MARLRFGLSLPLFGFATLLCILIGKGQTVNGSFRGTVEDQDPLANLVNATVGTVVGSEKVVQLPLNGRQFTQLILLTPGAAPQSSGQQGFFEIHTDYGAVSPAVNGARPEMNNFTIDGV